MATLNKMLTESRGKIVNVEGQEADTLRSLGVIEGRNLQVLHRPNETGAILVKVGDDHPLMLDGELSRQVVCQTPDDLRYPGMEFDT